MSISEITERVHSLGNAWEQFKQVNDQRVLEIKCKGAADPLYTEQLNKINNALDNYKKRMDALETADTQPGKAVTRCPVL